MDGDIGVSRTDTGWYPTIETVLFGSAILAGILLRFLLLDARPLTVDEGGLASQAFRVMLGQFGEAFEDGPLPTYGTATFLALFAAGDGAARLLSVMSGIVLTSVPYLLRGSLGRGTAIAAAWGFAVSPLLLFASRTVGSGVLPAALAILLWWLLETSEDSDYWRPFAIAGLLAALVSCGPTGLTCIVATGVAFLLSHPAPDILVRDIRYAAASTTGRQAVILFAVSSVALSTGLGANLRGIQYLVVDLWVGWLGTFNPLAPRGGLLLLLAMYELPVLLFAIGRLLYALAHRDRVDMFLSLWAMLLLLAGMFNPAVGLPKIVVALVPIYLLAARTVSGTVHLARGAAIEWRWVGGFILVGVPIVVAMILLNRSSVLLEPIPQEYVIGEVSLVLCAVIAAFTLLDGGGRKAVAWYVVAVAAFGLWIHTAAFLNYRTDTFQEEVVAGQQLSTQLRDAAVEGAYYSTRFNARLEVAPQLKTPLEWYLRNASNVDYAAGSTDGPSIVFADPGSGIATAGSERAPGLYSPSFDPAGFTWQGAWGWTMARSGLVRPNPRDIILRIPLSVW
ncbi:MAG TPA: glycosyltransferase family 39 protein [Chloroflexota bacterium]|nr:glycosyltransferase family 39 protein [Chloroflexota bacterium]